VKEAFGTTYGPWAVVAGASEGLGAEFARGCASRGLDVVLVARRGGLLEELASRIEDAYGVRTRTLVLDLARPGLAGAVDGATRDLDVGLLVYNAAFARIAPFMDQSLEDLLRTVDVNCRGPVELCHLLGRRMAARGRGGIVLMSSLVGMQGSALLAGYAASKAFDLVLAESLWDELRGRGVDVLACVAGATRTPNFLASEPRSAGPLAAPVMEPADVVERALDSLGLRPVVVAGLANRMTGLVLGRLVPRKLAVMIMGRTLGSIYRG
jgi:short-subunit dehydrogenase